MPQACALTRQKILHIRRKLLAQVRVLVDVVEKGAVGVAGDVEGGLVPLRRRAPPFCRLDKHHGTRRRLSGHEERPVEHARVGDEECRGGAVADLVGYGLAQEVAEHGHARDALELRVGHAGHHGHLGIWDGAVEGDEGQYAEMAEPADAGEILKMDSLIGEVLVRFGGQLLNLQTRRVDGLAGAQNARRRGGRQGHARCLGIKGRVRQAMLEAVRADDLCRRANLLCVDLKRRVRTHGVVGRM